MIRAGIVVAFGAGILVVPQIWWLFAAGLVAAAVVNWPSRRPREIRLSPELGESAAHHHYCPTCDRQWRHRVPRCVDHWASVCPACSVTHPAADELPRSA
jgi:hypothetical protein